MATSKEFCGRRGGTAGNAYLEDAKGNEVVTLAISGGDQSLLEQTDMLVGKNSGVPGESGTQNGKTYCVRVEVNAEGEPVKVLKARFKR